ncbi:LysR family transcriptional regulator [Actibacterium mucosum]|nr:LysR family transcriptional regulator [Actibacterium mucosum]
MRAFACVVREGSISDAARLLGVSQSAISQHIAKLEATLGAQVLIRQRDGIELTTAGQNLFPLADQFNTLDQQITEHLRGHATLEKGNLTIIANAPQPALSLIHKYAQQFPQVSIDFTLFDWASAMERVRERRVDVAIITEPRTSDDLYIQPLLKAQYVLYARMDHQLAKRHIISLHDVQPYTVILPEKGSLTQRVISKSLADSGIKPSRLVTMTTFPVMKEAILQGIGVGFFLEASSVKEDRLKEIRVVDLKQQFSTCVVIPKHKLGLRLTESFLQVVNA